MQAKKVATVRAVWQRVGGQRDTHRHKKIFRLTSSLSLMFSTVSGLHRCRMVIVAKRR